MRNAPGSTATRIVARTAIAAAISFLRPFTAPGATLTVSARQGTDSLSCGTLIPCKTIRYALTELAHDGDTIAVEAGHYSEKLDVRKSVIIKGVPPSSGPIPIPALATIEAVSGTNRVFRIRSGTTVSISNVVIQNGKSTGEGAGIVNFGNLTLMNSVVRNNALGKFGNQRCEPCVGAGISNRNILTLVNVTVSGNTANAGGARENVGVSIPLNQGAGIYNVGELTISESTIADNKASGSGGGIHNVGRLTIRTTTIAGNDEGIYNRAKLVIQNSTISTNGVGITSAPCNADTTLRNVTVARNGSGVVNEHRSDRDDHCSNADSRITVQNSILAESAPGRNCTGVILSADFNLDDGPSCGLQGSHDLRNTGPGLAALASNASPGGVPVAGFSTTATHALLPGSPAIDAGGGYQNGCPTTDQRGVTRPQHAACDIGSFEFQ